MKKTNQYLFCISIPVNSRRLAFVVLLSVFFTAANAQGNFSFSGLETVNYGVINLSAATGASWGTDRLSVPGYFSAVNGAAYTGSSDSYHINGYVKKYGNEAFSFPVGSGSDLRSLHISAPHSLTDAYATAWLPGDPGTGTDLTIPNAGAHPVTAVSAPLVAVSTIGQWDWQTGEDGHLREGSTGTGTGLTITVSIPDMSVFSAAENLRLAGWNGTHWIDLSGAATATGNTENSQLTGTMVEGITAIAIASISIAPSSAFSLTGVVINNCSVQLRWKEPNSTGITNITVQQSANGVQYNDVATHNANISVNEHGHSAIVPQTDFVNYYRIKVEYNNGAIIYSATAAFQVSCGIKEHITVYPNPVQNRQHVNLRIATSYRGPVRIFLITDVGQRLQEIKHEITASVTVVRINVQPYANAIYFIQILKKNGKQLGETQRLLKAVGQ